MKVERFTKRQRSKKSEKELAAIVGGRVQPASGSLPVKSLKGDVKTEQFVFDDKTTEAASYGVKYADWVKLRKQAWMQRRKPCLSINFEGRARLFVIDEQTFERLINEH